MSLCLFICVINLVLEKYYNIYSFQDNHAAYGENYPLEKCFEKYKNIIYRILK